MAIPPAHESAELIAAKAHFEHVGLEGLKRLRDEEALLLGETILMFSFNELNLRRVLEVLCEKGFLESKKKFQTWELVEKVKEGIVKAFPPGSELSVDLTNLDEIELRRPHRNVFAHWAAKRLDGMGALVFMTKDPLDAQAANGLNTEGKYGVTFSAMMVEDIRGLRNNIAKYGEWLARRIEHWYLVMGGEPSIPSATTVPKVDPKPTSPVVASSTPPTETENPVYLKFFRIWATLAVWSIIYVFVAPFARALHWNLVETKQTLESLADWQPLVTLGFVLAIAVALDLRYRKRYPSVGSWFTQVTLPHLFRDFASMLITAGSIIFIVSDLQRHKLWPISISLVFWSGGLWLEQLAEKKLQQNKEHE